MVGSRTKKETSLLVRIIRFFVLLFAVIGGIGFLTAQPACSHNIRSEQPVSDARLRMHVEMLSEKFAPRSYKHIWNLEKCADYIADHFKQAGAQVETQEFEVDGKIYKNVIAVFGEPSTSRMVVGAHYDAYRDTPGADDNASGVAGLIELAYLLGKSDLHQQVELVAFTLEEPPFFRTGNMGSARYAYGLRKQEVEVEAMICLEMIGFFSDEKGSQRFPSALLKLFYPDRGNYIALIGSTAERQLIRQVKASMKGATDLPVYSMCGPKSFPGLDFSDHLNFWNHGYKAVMVTDTAFYRNFAYHGAHDTIHRLDFDRMAKVVQGVYEAVMHLSNDPS